MDAGGAGRLNRSSPSCLNRPAQRTAFFHGLLSVYFNTNVVGTLLAKPGRARAGDVDRGDAVKRRLAGGRRGSSARAKMRANDNYRNCRLGRRSKRAWQSRLEHLPEANSRP